MAKKAPPQSKGDKKRRKYVRPRLTRHGELSQTALAKSY